jgi:Protein of unknown function (DUF4058)
MPLLDHFRPPIQDTHPGESFHSNWATRIADRLNDRWLSQEFLAEEFTSSEQMEIDIATYQKPEVNGAAADGSQTTALMPALWSPPAATTRMPAVFPQYFEVRVVSRVAGWNLVGAIELVSPSNKDRPDERRAFATKCASLLHEGVSVVVIDIVTARRSHLHNEIVKLMQADASFELKADPAQYAVSYRPVRRDERREIDIWTASFTVGSQLPTMPMRLTGDLFVPIEFEETYMEACRRRRLS